MNNLKLNFAAIIFAIFALTSCQKDNLSELQIHWMMVVYSNDNGNAFDLYEITNAE